MNKRMLWFLAGWLLGQVQVFGLATESIGPDKNVVEQPGWPKGIVELARHPSRVYTRWVNGNEQFYFQATPEAINELINLFWKSRLRDHQVLIRSGNQMAKAFSDKEYEYNVSLQVLSGIALHHLRQSEAADTLEPTLTIYVGEGLSRLKELHLPGNILVNCEVPGANLQEHSKPTRTAWHGCVQIADGRPAVNFEAGVTGRVTLWDKAAEEGIQVAELDREGFFSVPLSDAELAALRVGDLWLTVKVGNYLAKSGKTDPKYSVDSLAQKKDQARPLKIGEPAYYFGRLLFEDGSPAILQEKPWPGADIWVDFPYSGPARIDPGGLFRISLEPDQFEQLKARKPSKNIYVPNQAQGESSAKAIFPPELLSPEKDKAGTVKIPKPLYPQAK